MGHDRPVRKTRQTWNVPGHAHELTFSCYQRRPFLSRDRTRRWLADAVNRASGKYRFDVWAYVIMPEHVPLLIHPCEDAYDISGVLKSIKQSVARRAINWLKANNPQGLRQLETGQHSEVYRFWQDGGGYDRNLITTDALIASVNYIHRNPVRRKLVSKREDWYWSSYRQWLRDEQGPIVINKDSYRRRIR